MQGSIVSAIGSLKDSPPASLETYAVSWLSGKNIVIYGAGAFGREIAAVLLGLGIVPISFLDKHVHGVVAGIPVVHPASFLDKQVAVILAIVLSKPARDVICADLRSLGFTEIFDGQHIRAMYVPCSFPHTYDEVNFRKAEILKPLTYLADHESRTTYAANVSAHIRRDYSAVNETDAPEQYFVEGVTNADSQKYFVDCGAYTGDTFSQLVRLYPAVERYIAFEPISASFESLTQTVNASKIPATLFPMAVSDTTGSVGFTSRLGSSSISTNGDIRVPCIRLDDALHNEKPGFIKMDVEGEEPKALQGAQRLICEAVPDLAVCVYHSIEHFWEIPNMLHEWAQRFSLPYVFYLRTHSSACMETVLYAIRSIRA